MELEWAKRGCRARTTKQRARLDRLETLKNGTAPVRDKNVEIDSVETRMGKKTIELHHISKCFGDKVCIRDFDYKMCIRDRTCGGVCIMRITWMLAVLPVFPGIETIMLSYPVSWGITAVLFVIYYLKKFPKAENEKKNHKNTGEHDTSFQFGYLQ